MVVDHHELFRCGMARIISDESDMDVIAQAASGEEALRLLRKMEPNEGPDIIIMDVTMPGMSGMETINRVRRLYPNVRIIAISSVESGSIPARMLRAGAVAFLTKSIAIVELLRAIRAVDGGARYITHRLATRLAMESVDEEITPLDSLSERELQVALMLIDCNSINSISENLNLSPKTVYSYRYRIFEKLNIKSDAGLVMLAVKLGLTQMTDVEMIANL